MQRQGNRCPSPWRICSHASNTQPPLSMQQPASASNNPNQHSLLKTTIILNARGQVRVHAIQLLRPALCNPAATRISNTYSISFSSTHTLNFSSTHTLNVQQRRRLHDLPETALDLVDQQQAAVVAAPRVTRPTSHVICHMSHVTCCMLHVTRHMLHVTCHMSHVT